MRWDSDHVVTLTDELLAIAQELVRGDYLGRDASGAGLLRCQHQPGGRLGHRRAQPAAGALFRHARAATRATASSNETGDYTSRLALMEEAKTLPWSAVWDYHCLQQDVPVGEAWLADVKRYEREVLSRR